MFRDIHLRAQQTARIERSRNLTAIPAIFLGLAIWFSKTERGNFRDFPLLQGAEAYSRLTSTLSTIRLGLPYPQPTIRCRCRIWERNRPFPRCKPGVNLPRFAFPLGNRLPRPTKSPQGTPLGRPFQLKPPIGFFTLTDFAGCAMRRPKKNCRKSRDSLRFLYP